MPNSGNTECKQIRQPIREGRSCWTAGCRHRNRAINQSINQSIKQAIKQAIKQSINQSINQRFLKWPKWYATARTTIGNKTVGTEMS